MCDNPDFVIENGYLEKYKGSGGDVIIPAGVMSIGRGAFKGCTGLTSVTIPESVIVIEGCAFEECTSLTDVTIPQSVIEIGVRAFSDTPWFKNLGEFAIVNHILLEYQGKSKGVVIPEGVTAINYDAFKNCTGLTSVTIPESVTEIEQRAFEGCTGLTNLVILEGVNAIRGRAFYGCTGLTCVTIPESVTTIGWSAFEGCTSLTSVTIPESVTEIWESAFAGCCPALLAPLTPIANFAVENKPGACCGFAKLYLENAEIDEGIQAGYLKYIKSQKMRLYPMAVQHEELLRLMITEKMLIHKDIAPLLEECDKQNNVAAKTTVLDYVDKNLKPVDPLVDSEKEMKKMDRRAKQIERTGQLPAGELKKIWSTQKQEDGTLEITSYKGTETNVTIPAVIGKAAVTFIGEQAFSPCASRLTPEQRQMRKSLTSATIPEGVTGIGFRTFEDCTGLTSVTIPESITAIGWSAFENCTGLTNVTIPAGVTIIGWYAFKNCTGLTNVIIPKGVTAIGNYAFEGCASLTSVTILDGTTGIEISTFYGCNNLTIHAPADSVAEKYAKEKGIRFEAI